MATPRRRTTRSPANRPAAKAAKPPAAPVLPDDEKVFEEFTSDAVPANVTADGHTGPDETSLQATEPAESEPAESEPAESEPAESEPAITDAGPNADPLAGGDDDEQISDEDPVDAVFTGFGYDEELYGPWRETHYIGDVPVKFVANLRPPRYVDVEGKVHIPHAGQGRKLLSVHDYLHETRGVLRLTLEELILCFRAVASNGSVFSENGISAGHLGGRDVMFSRRENDVDVRRRVTLPEFIDLLAEKDTTGQRPDPVEALEGDLLDEDLPDEGNAGPTE